MTTTDPRNWLRARLVAPATWAIDDNGMDTMYLVAGAERCLLVDTGYGIRDLPALVASLCPLPATVFDTHGHPDHV
jgi:glyoxylase-like metal-dependent hydrolase (beta-lactamase superfamily II)